MPAGDAVPVAAGGTGATSAASALAALGGVPLSGGVTLGGNLGLPTNGLQVGTNQLVAANGRVGVGIAPLVAFHTYVANAGSPAATGTATTGVTSRTQNTSVNLDFGTYSAGHNWLQGRLASDNSYTFDFYMNPIGGATFFGPGGYGYAQGIGAGGSVTQATGKTTGVTLNKLSGRVTMHNASLPGGAAVSFQVSNSLVGTYDQVSITPVVGHDWSKYDIRVAVGPGYFVVYLENVTIGALAEALSFNFQVQKGSAS